MSDGFKILVAFAAGGACAAAGVYLLTQHSLATADQLGGGTSWFEIIAHGIGIYFIGKGVFVWAMLWPSGQRVTPTVSRPQAPPG